MADYNIADIFEEIELDLIRRMKKSLGYHFRDEEKLDINYNQWQVEQLKALEEYKRRNPKLFKGQFSEVNKHITDSIRGSYKSGKLRQEKQYLEAIKKGYKAQKNPNLSGAFFKVNDKKLESLVKATTSDMAKAESSILRRSSDLYRQTILKTQTYLNLGSTTLDQAIDMATHDFLAQGINSIKYSNGRMVNIRSYSEMSLRTANTRAQLMGEGTKRQELGESLVKVSSYGECSETCLPYQGLVYIDDVYSAGTKGDGDYPLLSQAMNGGLFHPNCRHTMSTYYEGISKPPKDNDYDIKGPENPTSNDELNNINANIRRYRRLKEGSLHPDNVSKYTDKLNEWQDKLKEYNLKNGVEPKIPKKAEPSEAYNSLIESVKANKVDYNEVKPLSKKLSEDEIINKLYGGDMTKGSCSSLALSYIGNKNGLDVTDFRGGSSQNVFSANYNIQKFAKLPGVNGKLIKMKKEALECTELLKNLELNKEYYLAVGKHASIVRNTEHGLEYLELQSAKNSGWTSFKKYGSTYETLNKRFGAKKSINKVMGITYESTAVLIDVDSFNGSAEFKDILGYINTLADKQKKGIYGTIK